MSLGTTLYTWFYGKYVGNDDIGNKYYTDSGDPKDLNSKRDENK